VKRLLAALALALAIPGASLAQTAPGLGPALSSGGATVASLVADGYEIKAAVPNGAKYVVFLQKDKKAYACEFVTVTQSRCGEIK
jgi:hypothetical protein